VKGDYPNKMMERPPREKDVKDVPRCPRCGRPLRSGICVVCKKKNPQNCRS
jgi:hypothetical protein